MVDRAPDGEIEVAGGVFKHAYNANWKVYLENLCDAAHPWFTHRSSIDAAQQQSDDVFSDGSGEIAIRQMRQNGAPYSFWESQVGIWTYPNGHSYLGDYHDDAKLVAAMQDPTFRDYIAALEEKKGKQTSHSVSAPLEQQHLSKPVVHEPIPATPRDPPCRGQPNRGSHLQFPAQGSAQPDVPKYNQLRKHRQRDWFAGPHRRSGNLQPDWVGSVE
jgi:Vanillate O-demethylase oxygenase C-terminal domain